MIHLCTGKIRPCTQVLALSSPMLPAPITHAYCKQRHLLLVRWHTESHRDARFGCNTQLWHRQMPDVYTPHSLDNLKISCTNENYLHIVTMCAPVCTQWFWCQVHCAIRREWHCLRGHHGWQPVWSQSQQMSIQLHPSNRQIAAPSASPFNSTKVISDGCYSKLRPPWKIMPLVRNESALVSAFCLSTHPPQWWHQRHVSWHLPPPSPSDITPFLVFVLMTDKTCV